MKIHFFSAFITWNQVINYLTEKTTKLTPLDQYILINYLIRTNFIEILHASRICILKRNRPQMQFLPRIKSCRHNTLRDNTL